MLACKFETIKEPSPQHFDTILLTTLNGQICLELPPSTFDPSTQSPVNAMNLLADCLDSLILALRLIAQSIAFLFGAHFFLLLHLVHFLATDPVAALQRRSSSSTSASSASRDCRQSNRGRARREDTRSRRRIVVASTRYRPPRKFLHLPSLEPRPHDTTQYYVAKSAIDYASSFFDIVRNKISDELQELGHHLESRGGKTG